MYSGSIKTHKTCHNHKYGIYAIFTCYFLLLAHWLFVHTLRLVLLAGTKFRVFEDSCI